MSLRILVPLSHALHRRNLVGSGLVSMLEKRGHQVTLLEDLKPRLARLRKSLRLMTLVQGELRSRTYRHKATLRRSGQRLEAAVWRAIRRRGVDLEALAIRIEGGLPMQRETLYSIIGQDMLAYDVLLWPTLVHQDATDNDLIKAAKALSIPVVAAIASWDSLTSKGSFLVRPDRLIVWGVASVLQAMEFHSFDYDAVEPTGPPHFWPYESGVEPLGDKILVAGTSLHYWQQEKEFVAALEKQFPGRVLHRQHPRTSQSGWAMDVESPKRDLQRSAVVVAAFSTIVIEAALMGRPSILVAFGTGEQGRTVDHLAYDHMAEIARWPFVFTAYERNQLIDWAGRYLGSSVRGGPVQETHMRDKALRIANCKPGIRERFCEAVERAR